MSFRRASDAQHGLGTSAGAKNQTKGPSSSSYSFLSGIVADIIANPVKFLNGKYQSPNSKKAVIVKEAMANNETLDICEREREKIPFAPAGSIISYITDDALSSGGFKICAFPFFSHMCLPIKAGEHVWILKEETGGTIDYYWMTRKVTSRQADDVNMTYLPRSAYVTSAYNEANPTGEGSSTGVSGQAIGNLFSAISDQSARISMLPAQLTYNTLQASCQEYLEGFVQEPVPRKFSRRHGSDCLIQGSNNQVFQMTTEKFYDEDEEQGLKNFNIASDKSEKISENNIKNLGFSGAIDIYVGHEKQRINEIKNHESKDMAKVPNVPEGFNTILCQKDNVEGSDSQNLGNHETDKTQGLQGENENPDEGNDDPRNVFSRLYMSMNCSPDKKFELSTINTDLKDLEENEQVATLLSYTDHTRILSENTLRMVKMGKEEDKKSSFLEMKDNGDIVIQAGEGENAAKIILYATGDICLVPGKQGLLHLGSDFDANTDQATTEGYPLCGIQLPVQIVTKGMASNGAQPGASATPPLQAGAYPLAVGTSPTENATNVPHNPFGAYSTKVMIKL